MTADMRARPRPLTIGFYILFALWFTAIRYSGPGFYSRLVSPMFQDALVLATVAVFGAVGMFAARRGIKARAAPWADLLAAGGSIVAFDLVWRFYLSPHAWDAFKLASVALDAATPVVAALGVAALIGEWKRGSAVGGP